MCTENQPHPAALRLDARDRALCDLVGSEPLERVATGFRFVEGPVWHPVGAHLIFSDIQADVMYMMREPDRLTVFRKPSRMANGNAYDRSGRLLTCEHAASRLVRLESDGRLTTLAQTFRGRQLNSPNDVVVARDGTIFFTDPAYGRTAEYGVLRATDLDIRGVYRLDPISADLTLLADDFDGPNGLCLSLDEKALFVNDTERMHIRQMPVRGNGPTSALLWAETRGEEPGAPDGMKIDRAGTLFCCGPGGLHVFDPYGRWLGVIRIPEVAANFTWGGSDLRTLYVCATSSVYRFRMRVPGPTAF